MIKDAHIHNRSFRRSSQIKDNLEIVAPEKTLEIEISSKLAIVFPGQLAEMGVFRQMILYC